MLVEWAFRVAEERVFRRKELGVIEVIISVEEWGGCGGLGGSDRGGGLEMLRKA